MLKLAGKIIHIENGLNNNSQIFSVSTNPLLPSVLKVQKAYLVNDTNVPAGFAHYLVFSSRSDLVDSLPENSNYSLLGEEFSYLDHDDIIKLSSDKLNIKVLFRASSPHNGILVTEQCNHYCLMCSQPPKNIDDSWILNEIEEMIPLIPKETGEIGFTGGEPTLYGERFLSILNLTKSYLPRTAIHILSNGRAFKDRSFAEKYASINHHDMMVGIQIYSDDPTQHDYVVQAKGAFDETIQGILNLKRLHQKVEVRVVIHKQTIDRLESLCEFLVRNLLFVDHVALMGLEMMGFTRANLDKLWIDPYDYKDKLSNAVSTLAKAGMNVSVYNHQLCLVNRDILPYYRKSISDWKNEYADECKGCTKIDSCGGFFASGIQHGYSKNLKPF